jgi:hypothetical protein
MKKKKKKQERTNRKVAEKSHPQEKTEAADGRRKICG